MTHAYLERSEEGRRGFTLVETLVAIAVLVIAIAGPLYAVHRAITVSYAARDKLIANSLAQEALEYVRGVRDNNYLSDAASWMGRFDGTGASGANCTTGGGGTDCIVSPSQGSSMIGTISQCAGVCTPLDLFQNRYTHGGSGTPTKFTRSVRVACSSYPCSTAENATVTVTVTWTTLRVPYTLTVSEQLYNWL